MGVEFSANTLINIFTNDITNSSGSYSRAGKKLSLGSNSWVKYEKDISAVDSPVKTDQLLIVFEATMDDEGITSRYNAKIKANLVVHYYSSVSNDDGTMSYEDGPSQTFCITPYLSNETDGKINEYTFKTKNEPISRLELYIYNATDSQIGIVNWGIYNSLTVTESLGNSMAIECTLTDKIKHPNGFTLKFTTGDLVLKAVKDAATNVHAGYTINDKYVVRFSESDVEL